MLGTLCSLFSLANLFLGHANAVIQEWAPPDPQAREQFIKIAESATGPLGMVIHGGFAAMNLIVFLGGVAMLNQRMYGLALAASILAMFSFDNCCCLLGLPAGIWSLMVLSKPEVKALFH